MQRQVGEFVIDQEIGDGSSAKVFRAYQPTINRYVAVKIISYPSPTPSSDPTFFERRFNQEAQVLASLEHPHIVPIYHFGISQHECAYIAMRLMRGSLAEVLRQAPLPDDRVIDIALQLLAGLGYAHRRGMIHRDIKPGNILFDEAGSACLTDFSLIRLVEETQTDMLHDTALYTAPEQIRGASADQRSDIYSLGVVLYQMVTGRLPSEVESRDIAALLHKIEFEEPIPPSQLNPAVSPELERIVLRALRKEPRERFFSVDEMTEAIEAIPGTHMSDLQLRARRIPAYASAIATTLKRPSRLIGAVLLLLALILFVVLVESVINDHRPLQAPTVIVNGHGTPDAAVPSAAEIDQARRSLGERGFIAYIACSLDSEFQVTGSREMADDADTYGLAFRVYDSGGDAYKALTLIERARLEGARAIILCPLKPDLLGDSLTSIQNAHMPLVLTDVLSKNYGAVMLDADNVDVGRIAGEYIAKLLTAKHMQQPHIAILDAPDYSFSDTRVQGFIDGIHEYFQDAQVIGRYPVGMDRTVSETTISDLLSSGQPLDAVFSVTDSGAYGAVSALTRAGAAPDAIPIVSVNAENMALDDIYNHAYLSASVDIARTVRSRAAVDAAVKLLGGGTIPQIVNLPAGMVITSDIMVGKSPGS